MGSFLSWLTSTGWRRAINITLLTTLLYSFVRYHGTESRAAAISSLFGTKELHSKAQDKSLQMDRLYGLGLQSQHGLSAGQMNVLFGEASSPTNSKYTATIVLGRRDNETERVRWLEDVQNIQDFKVFIVDNTETDLPHLQKNHGREAAVYLTYIVENYNKLNDITFFWHTDKVVWHNSLLMQWDSVLSLNRMNRQNIMTQGFVPSRCDHWPGCPHWVRFNPSKAEHTLDPHRLENLFTVDFFQRIFPDVSQDDYPPYLAGTCCSQFALSRDQIRWRPLETYKRLLNWILEYERDDYSGTVLEYLWPYIFLGRGSHCPSMQECYCKTYDFCIENDKELEQLETWNSLRTRREEVKWQVNFVENAMETKKKTLEGKGASPEEIAKAVEALESELARLQEEQKTLEDTTWQRREDIVHHWRLPSPPVGW